MERNSYMQVKPLLILLKPMLAIARSYLSSYIGKTLTPQNLTKQMFHIWNPIIVPLSPHK